MCGGGADPLLTKAGRTTETAYTPQAFVGFGRNWYVAAGVGLTSSDDFTSDHFYIGRFGWNLDLLPESHLSYSRRPND